MVTSVCNSGGTRCGAMRQIIKLFDPDSVELKRARCLRHMHCSKKGSTSLRHISWTSFIKLDLCTKNSPPAEIQGQNPFPPHYFLCVQVQTSTSTFVLLTWTFPLTKVVMSFSFSKMESVCSRLCSSHSQCSVISLREVPGGKVLDIISTVKLWVTCKKRVTVTMLPFIV